MRPHLGGLLILAACVRPLTASPNRVLNLPPSCPTAGASVAADATKPPAVEGEEEEREWVLPCREGTAEYAAAAAELSAVSKGIETLAPAGDPKALAAQLEKMTGDRCFLGIGDELKLATFESALSLKTYWRAGGDASFEARLAWNKLEGRRYWIAPSIRKALTSDGTPKHPIAPLLCPASAALLGAPGACGSETAGWLLRADTALRSAAAAKRASFLDYDPPQEMPKTHAICMKEAIQAPALKRYVTFSECMAQTGTKQDAMPLGSFRAPTSGWLLLRGRRGHHSSCDELRAYDLASGAFYKVGICHSMFGNAPPPTVQAEKGKLPVEALREAALMMFLANAADHDVIVSGEGRHMPPEIDVHIPADGGMSLALRGIGSSSGRTTLVYQWLKGGKSTATGTVEWPDADTAADEHATSLLMIAEAGMTKGCAPAPLPSALPWAARKDHATRINAGDNEYFPDDDGPEYDQLERALAGMTSCP